MSKYNDDLYQDAITATIGDIYHSNASPKSKIASMRVLIEYYIRRLIKHNPNSDLTLGHNKTKNELLNKGINEEFFWKAFDIVHSYGNDSSHSKKFNLPTQEDLNIVSEAVITIQAYLFYNFFKKFKFGDNLDIVRHFSLLPPFFRYKVLHELMHYYDYENMNVICKYGLSYIKAYEKNKALELLESEKEILDSHRLPITSESAIQVFNLAGPLAYAEYLQEMNCTIYEYLKQQIERHGDTFETLRKYKTFEEAKQYYLSEGKVEGNTQDVIEFNNLMKYIYAGRKPVSDNVT